MEKHNRAFTLIEAIMVMGIISLVVICIPLIMQWARQQGVGHAVNQLQSDLQLARLMAISQQKTCSIQFNQQGKGRYINLLNGQHGDLSMYKGGVHFLKKGPDGKKMSPKIDFNRQGMSSSVAPCDIFIADRTRSKIYRLRIMLPGGVSRYHWQSGRWQ